MVGYRTEEDILPEAGKDMIKRTGCGPTEGSVSLTRKNTDENVEMDDGNKED